MLELLAGRIHHLVESITALQPRNESKNLVGRADLETAGAAVGSISVEIHGGGFESSPLFGVIEDFVLGHGENSPGGDFDAGGGASELEALFVVRHQLPYAILSGGLQRHVERCVDIQSTFTPALVALLRSCPEAFKVFDVFDDVVAEESGVHVTGETAGPGRRDGHKRAVDRGVDGGLVLSFGDVLLGVHRGQDDVASGLVSRVVGRILEVAGRRVLNDSHEARGLSGCQVSS